MQNRKWIGPKLHERPQPVSPLSSPSEPQEEVTAEEVAPAELKDEATDNKKNKDKKNN